MMQVELTKHLVRDLMPAYLSGTAHPDTVRAVEAYLAEHPELLSDGNGGETPDPTRADRQQLAALQRTRRLIRTRSIHMGAAVFFSLLPVSFWFDGHGTHWLFAAQPVLAGLLLIPAAFFWINVVLAHRRLRLSGLT